MICLFKEHAFDSISCKDDTAAPMNHQPSIAVLGRVYYKMFTRRSSLPDTPKAAPPPTSIKLSLFNFALDFDKTGWNSSKRKQKRQTRGEGHGADHYLALQDMGMPPPSAALWPI